MDYNTWIHNQPAIWQSGYIESRDDAARLQVTLVWHGDTAKAAPLLKEAARRRLSVRLTKIATSRDDLLNIERIGFTVNRGTGGEPVRVVGVNALPGEGGRPILYVVPTRGGTRPVTAAKAAHSASISGFRLDVDPAGTADGARSSDKSPFDAGGLMKYGSSICSSGPTITYNGAAHITTARHCNEGKPWHDASSKSRKYGNLHYTNKQGASVLGSRGVGRSYGGGWTSKSDFAIKGLRITSDGDHVCTSGGNSGGHCNVIVNSTYGSFNDGHGTINVVQAKRQSGISVIQGDSGGPVVVKEPGSRWVMAGMIQGYVNGHTGHCGSVHYGGRNKCSATVLFSDMQGLIDSWGRSHAKLKTG